MATFVSLSAPAGGRGRGAPRPLIPPPLCLPRALLQPPAFWAGNPSIHHNPFATTHTMHSACHLLVVLLVPDAAAFVPSIRPLAQSAAVRAKTVVHGLPPVTMKAAVVATNGNALIQAVNGVAGAYAALTRPAKTGLIVSAVAFAFLMLELKKRRDLIVTGDGCMLGDEGKCETYDSKIEDLPAWKLKLAQDALPNSNTLQEKLG